MRKNKSSQSRRRKKMRLTTHNTIPFAKIADSRRPRPYIRKNLRIERSIFHLFLGRLLLLGSVICCILYGWRHESRM